MVKFVTISLILLIHPNHGFGIQKSQVSRKEANYDARLRPLIPRLKRKVDVLIRLPQTLKPFLDPRKPQLYPRIEEAESDIYRIRIESEEDCDGASYCALGWISGELRSDKNKDEIDNVIKEGKVVRLATDLKGYYMNLSADSRLHDILLWQQEGVFYTVAMYGSEQELSQIANSMVRNSPINL